MNTNNILMYCPIPTWASTHALALLNKLEYTPKTTHFIIGSYLTRFDNNGVEEYKRIITQRFGCAVYDTLHYDDNNQLYFKLLSVLQEYCSTEKGGKIFFPNHIYSFIHTLSSSNLVTIAKLISKSNMTLYAFDHGPGDSIDFYDKNTLEALSFAKKIYLSTPATYPLYKDSIKEKIELVSPSYLSQAIETLSKMQNIDMDISIFKETKCILIVGGTYDYSIGNSCKNAYIELIATAKNAGYKCLFKPHKHQYHKEQLHWLDSIKDSGALIINDIGCSAEVLVHRIEPVAVFSVCSSTLHHCFSYLQTPAFTMLSPELLQEMMENSTAALGRKSAKADSYRFLEVMLCGMKFPHYQKFLHKCDQPKHVLLALCTETEQGFSQMELVRRAFYLREQSVINKEEKFNILIREHDSFYLDSVLACRSRQLNYAIYGTGQGGVDCLHVAERVGYLPKFFVDKTTNSQFTTKTNINVVLLEDVDYLKFLDLILVSSITYANDISAKIAEIKALSNLKVITINYPVNLALS